MTDTVIANWTIDSVLRPQFQTQPRATVQNGQNGCANELQRIQNMLDGGAYYVNESRSIPGFDRSLCNNADLFQNATEDKYDASAITFLLQFAHPDSSSFPDAYANAENGRMLVTSDTVATYSLLLVARDSAGSTASVANWTMAVQSRPDLNITQQCRPQLHEIIGNATMVHT